MYSPGIRGCLAMGLAICAAAGCAISDPAESEGAAEPEAEEVGVTTSALTLTYLLGRSGRIACPRRRDHALV